MGDEDPRLRHGRSPEPQAKADALGRFQIESLQPGAVRVLARAEGHSDSEWTEAKIAPGETTEIELRLASGGRIEGSVDPARGAVAGRKISSFSSRGTIGWRDTETDERGQFVIANVIPQDYIIELRPEGYPSAAPAESARAGVRRKITIRDGETTKVVFEAPEPALHVAGRVRCGAAPGADLIVTANLKAGGGDTRQQASTGPDGGFEIDIDGPGEYTFNFMSEGGSYATATKAVERSKDAVLEFDLPGGSVSGVLLSPKGEPLERVPLTILRLPAPDEDEQQSFYARLRRARTDAKGAFEFRLLPPGTYVVRAPDGLRYDSPATRIAYGNVIVTGLEVKNREIESLALKLEPECHVRGRVVDSKGAGIGGVLVKVENANGVAVTAYYDTKTNPDGRFDVPSVAAGSYRVLVRLDTRRAKSDLVAIGPEKAGDVTIELP